MNTAPQTEQRKQPHNYTMSEIFDPKLQRIRADVWAAFHVALESNAQMSVLVVYNAIDRYNVKTKN